MTIAFAPPPLDARTRAAIAATVALGVGFVGLRIAALYFAHPLDTLDGAMQTWFAVDAFADGRQLGHGFQSYLGVTMMLFLVPFYLLFGGTIFAASAAATTAVCIGLVAQLYALLRLIGGLTPAMRWVFVAVWFAFLANKTGLDPGNSLRPLRWALPFLMLPFVLPLLARLQGEPLRPALLLGAVGGVALLWSNDSGLPTVAALGVAILLSGLQGWRHAAIAVAAYGAGVLLTATALLLAVTHGAPLDWLRYNFVDLPGDQIWYFAPWSYWSRVLSPADLWLVILTMTRATRFVFVFLLVSLAIVTLRRLRNRSEAAPDAAFVFLGLSVIGTALLPQIGGHIGEGYNKGMFTLGLVSPLIAFRAGLIAVLRRFPPPLRLPRAVIVVAAVLGSAAALADTARDRARVIELRLATVPIPELGLRVSPAFAEDVAALRLLRRDLDAADVPRDARLLATYPSAMMPLLGADSASPFGSIIHALGDANRQAFADVVAERRVTFVTTINPSWSTWEDWNLRSNWPFYRALIANYQPVARNAQHILFARRAVPMAESKQPLPCTVSTNRDGSTELTVTAPVDGVVDVTATMAPLPDLGHTQIMTAMEASPYTRVRPAISWPNGPQYGIPPKAEQEFYLPVAAGVPSSIRLRALGGHKLSLAGCRAHVVNWPTTTADLPSIADYQRSLNGALP